jgi:RNA polymerase sigma-70 factor (ECF subfamily)
MTVSIPLDPWTLFDRFHQRIRGFILMTVRDPWVADDLTQDVFVRAMDRINGLREPQKLEAWLFKIAHNICRDYFRSSGRHPLQLLETDDACPNEAADTQKALERHEMSACVQRQADKLPDKYRSVIWLFDQQGFTLQETADILGITLANTKVRIHRARRRLRSILQANCRFNRDERDVLVCTPKLSEAAGNGKLLNRASALNT